MGQNDQNKGEPQNTAPERDGHEFPRTEEAESNRAQDQGKEDSVGAGQAAGATSPALKEPLGSTIPEETQGSWRPTADPAAGDIARSSDEKEETSS